ncbi:DUF4249 domain-containing protein [Neolewinella persica]|uniref:DUF4249 domain-containing protein n=1 Tax=Neolewinella persica TaxID=70998 RepID=UPI0003673F43|nr:DUF4249 domain-containing protein [Neolewinella persica]
MNSSKSKQRTGSIRLAGFLILSILCGCLEPTKPEFQIEESFILVEGNILAGEGQGEIRIRESNFREVALEFESVAGAEVLAIEANGTTVSWGPGYEPGRYIPPPEAVVLPGETWHVEITLPDGTSVISAPETIPEPVEVSNLTINFVQNSSFDEGLNRFVPRFELFLDYVDPADQENYYAYDYHYWEEITICASCVNGRWRDGVCIPFDNPRFNNRYDYLCDTQECFSTKAGEETRYGSDAFTNGSSLTGFPLGGIIFTAYGGMLVEGSVYSITKEAFDYGKVIQDLVEGNSGLNPTTPAALDGNVRNVDPGGRDVLGFIGAASKGSARAFVDRTTETGSPLPFDNNLRLEPLPPPAVPPRAPCNIPGVRTAERPVGWP